MKTIRPNCFESNSSSMHSLVINRRPEWNQEGKHIDAKFLDFTNRELIPRTKPEEKFSYLYMVLCGLLDFPNSKNRTEKYTMRDAWYKKYPTGEYTEAQKSELDKIYNLPEEYTVDEVKELGKRFELLKKCFNIINDKLKESNSATFSFDDLDIRINTKDGYCYLISKTEEYFGTGCYGNKSVAQYFGLNGLADDINRFIRGEVDENFIRKSVSPEYYFRDMFAFAFDKNSILIQHTDEYSDKDYKKHTKIIQDYVNKCHGDVEVIWPIGG